MLAGLLFATHEAQDRPGMLAATLPFGAATLIEYQARLLIESDAAQMVVVVSRLTPELVGAIARIGKRGVAVDTVRTAAEAMARLHPLARVMMVADGLVTTASAVAALVAQGGDALLVMPGHGADPAFERVGGGAAWAGLALLDGRRLGEAARFPDDYDLQSTLLHVAGEAGARHLSLPGDGLARGHGIERRAAALEERGRAVLSASMAGRPGWFDRFVLRPIAWLAIPPIARRQTASAMVAGVGGAIGVAGLVTVATGATAIGFVAVLAGVLVLEVARALTQFRDEPMALSATRGAILALPVLAAMLLGYGVDDLGGTATGRLLALGAIMAGGLAEYAVAPLPRRAWWGSAPGYLTVLTLAVVARFPVIGLSAVALYATATLTAAVAELRREA
jgi:hypothetical protein